MAGAFGDRLRRAEDDAESWFRDRIAQTSQAEQDLENAGRDAWHAATKAGVDIAARTPQDLRALGARVLYGQSQRPPRPSAPGAVTGSNRQPTGSAPTASAAQPILVTKPSWMSDGVWNGMMQMDAVVRGATNLLTFGKADNLAAGTDAFITGGLDNWQQRYEANLAQEHARDRYDAVNRPVAQTIGQVGGTLMGLGRIGAAKGAVALARLPGAAATTGREVASLLGGGAATGLGTQVASDIATGRPSSLGDKAGAALGGAVGAVALPLGPRRAGAIGGWTTSAAQDLFNDRPLSLDHAGQSAIFGGLFGRVAGDAGTAAANDLSPQAKGRLGEAMGDIRSTINGQMRDPGPKFRDYLPGGGYWYPDGRSGSIRFEDKFGYSADLSKNQRQAQSLLGPDFILNHFLPEDVGGLFSVPAVAAGSQAVSDATPPATPGFQVVYDDADDDYDY